MTMNTLLDEGEALLGLGRLDEAESELDYVVTFFAHKVPPDTPFRLEAISSLAAVRIKKRDFARASPALEDVVVVKERSNVVPSELGQSKFELARALDAAKQQPSRSAKLAESALATFETHPSFENQRREVERFLDERRESATPMKPSRAKRRISADYMAIDR